MRLDIIIRELSDKDVSWGSAPTAFWLSVIPDTDPLQNALAEPTAQSDRANLIVISASLPSLRAFVRHIAPKFIGERQSSPGHNNNVDLVTFGGSGLKRNNFTRCTDELYWLETVQHEVDISTDHDAVVISMDSDSQKGILQTRTATVSSQLRKKEGRCNAGQRLAFPTDPLACSL